VELLISVWIFVACTALSKYLSNTAVKHLNTEQKSSLIDGLSVIRAYETIPVAMLLYVFVVYVHSAVVFRNWSIVCGGVLLAYLVLLAVINYRKIKNLGLSPVYVKQHYISLVIQYLGCIQMIVVFMLVYRQ